MITTSVFSNWVDWQSIVVDNGGARVKMAQMNQPHSVRPDERSSRGAAASIRPLLGNALILASVAGKFVSVGRVAVASAVLRALPRAPRRVVGRLMSWANPVMTPIRLAADGRMQDALAGLRSLWDDAVRRGDGRRAAGVLDSLVALHEFATARAWLAEADLEAGLPVPATTRARVLVAQGDFTAAHRVLAGVAGASRLRRQVEGELSSLNAVQRIDGEKAAPSSVQAVARVVHVVTTALPEAQSGYTIRTQGIARAQEDQGVRVEVVTRLGFPVDRGVVTARRDVTVDGVAYHRMLPAAVLPREAGARLDVFVDELAKRVRETGADLLHAHSKHDNAQAALAVGRRLGRPVVYEVRGFLEETWRTRGGSADSDQYRLTRQAETECMMRADAVVTLSRSMRDEICARGVPSHKVDIVPNAVADAFLEAPPSALDAKRGLGIDEAQLVLGFSGTLNRYEGVDVLIKALGLLNSPALTLLVVGGGPDKDRLVALADAEGVDARFVGRVPHAEVRRHIAAMDLFCVPRHRTPVTQVVPPLKPLEALATGVPLLVSDLPPLIELLDEGEFGWAAAPEDVAAWAERIDGLRYDPGVLRQAGDAGRNWACRERTWSRLAQHYRGIYDKAVECAAARVEDGRGTR